MYVEITKIVYINDASAGQKFIEARVLFSDDSKSLHNGCEVTVFIEEDGSIDLGNLTLSDVDRIALERSRDFLRQTAAVPPNEYRRTLS